MYRIPVAVFVCAVLRIIFFVAIFGMWHVMAMVVVRGVVRFFVPVFAFVGFPVIVGFPMSVREPRLGPPQRGGDREKDHERTYRGGDGATTWSVMRMAMLGGVLWVANSLVPQPPGNSVDSSQARDRRSD